MDSHAEQLMQDIAEKRCVLAVGAGVTIASTGESRLTWPNLVRSGARFADDRGLAPFAGWLGDQLRDVDRSIERDYLRYLLNVAEEVEHVLKSRNGQPFLDWLEEEFKPLKPVNDALLRAIGNLDLPIITTNYDTLLDRYLGRATVTWRDETEMHSALVGRSSAVAHLHGVWSDPFSVVLGASDYERITTAARPQALSRSLMASRSIVFIGFGGGLSDPNFAGLRAWFSETFGATSHRSYRLCLSTEYSSLLREHAQESVQPVSYGEDYSDLSNFLTGLTARSRPESNNAPVPDDSDSRPSVWYYDDDLEWTSRFESSHRKAFSISTFNEPVSMLTRLAQLAVNGGALPDIVLTDLYAPREGTTSSRVRETMGALQAMISAESELRSVVDAAWHPAGVDIVRTVREFYSHDVLPIAMHTQQGLVLLRDELIRQLERYQVGWVVKNRFSPQADRLVLDGIARRSGHRMRVRPQILIIDDNPRYIELFRERQADFYEITSLSSEAEVMGKLAELEAHVGLPDMLVVDLYYPHGTPESDALIPNANKKLAEFAALQGTVEALVKESFEPVGLGVLRQIREIDKLRRLPVAIYTQTGLLTLGDEHFREIEQLGARWMLKDRYDRSTEELMIAGEVLRSRSTA